MEWCPNQVALILDFRIFQGVFPVPHVDRHYRYELGVSIAHISWRNTVHSRERLLVHLTRSWANEVLRQRAIEHRGHEHVHLRQWCPRQRVLEISSWGRLDMASPSPWCASIMTIGPEHPHRGGPPSPPAGRFQAHAMHRALVDRVAAWARQWVPSIVV
eukprot:3482742-Pyramimonas_sp.AAC.1